jgi:hypothetical protein
LWYVGEIVEKQRDEARAEVERLVLRANAAIGKLHQLHPFEHGSAENLSIKALDFLQFHIVGIRSSPINAYSFGEWAEAEIQKHISVRDLTYNTRNEIKRQFRAWLYNNLLSHGLVERSKNESDIIVWTEMGREVLERLSQIASRTS